MVIGQGSKPWISLPKGNGIKLSIIEDSASSLGLCICVSASMLLTTRVDCKSGRACAAGPKPEDEEMKKARNGLGIVHCGWQHRWLVHEQWAYLGSMTLSKKWSSAHGTHSIRRYHSHSDFSMLALREHGDESAHVMLIEAWVNHGKGKKDEGGNDGAVIIRITACSFPILQTRAEGSGAVGKNLLMLCRNARIVNQPPDGSCLFHSLSYGLSDRSALEHDAA
eukprot:4554353-Amphidinium_carterae.1